MTRLLLASCLSLTLIQGASAQIVSDSQLSEDQLDYYLMQAFQAKSAQQRIAINHIGIQVQAAGDGYLVTASLEDYPAQLAGIERGDIIRTADGEPFHPVYSFNQAGSEPAEEFTRFPASDREYRLEVSRNGTSRSVALTPVYENLFDSYRTATTNSIQIFPAGNKTVGYVRFWAISRASADVISMERIIQQLEQCDGLILDLRNSFGYLSASHLDLFFPNRRSYLETSGAPNEHGELKPTGVTGDDEFYQRPITILHNSRTRGGPELFAYQMAKMRRVVLLGETTPGKIGEYVMDTSGADRLLHYSPADDVLIDGLRFESNGVVPEQTVVYPFEQSTRSDPQYATALDELLSII